ncbi:MAG: iron uptake porin [Cyanobacteria bacterium MAG CAR3_bin_5]|nr:iron uptake porin [Cyanobacteria bacterium MAG CAR3_bin_5]
MKAFQRLLIAAPAAALLPVALAPMGVLANDLNLDLDAVQEYSISQNASIRDFSDVYPTDWAYQALAELVETYGCVGGYPDGTFRGDQPITRYEMAAVLSACLDSMSAKMDMMEDDMDSMENMEMLKAEFAEELIELKGEVDGLTAKVSALEETQFSTTTKAEFEIATDFVFFSTKDEEARGIQNPEVPEVPEVEPTYELLEVKGEIWNPLLDRGRELAVEYSSNDGGTAGKGVLIRKYASDREGNFNSDSVYDATEEGATRGISLTIIQSIPDDNANDYVYVDKDVFARDGKDSDGKEIRYIDLDLDGEYDAGDTPATSELLTGVTATELAAYVLELTDGDSNDLPEEQIKSILEAIDRGTKIEEGTPAVPAVPATPYGEDNSGLALSSSVEIAFTTSFTGSDKLTFKLEGDVMSMESHYSHYLALGNFYDVAASGNTNVEFSGFTYERNFDLGVPVKLTLGTDFADLDGIEGIVTYYDYDGYDGYGIGDFGDTGLGFNVALLESDAGTVNFSASYAVDGDHASDQTGKKGFLGEDTDRSFALGLNWTGALFGGNDSFFTVAYQNISENEADYSMKHGDHYHTMTDSRTKSIIHLLAGAYLTDTIAFSGNYSFGTWDYASYGNKKTAQWAFSLNMDDAFFPGNSAGISYGTPEYVTDMSGMNPTKVLELYYSFKVNDNFTVPVYLDFINNAGNAKDGNGTSANAFAFAIRPTLTF